MIEYFVHVTLAPWLVVLGGGLVAQVSTSEAVAQSGFWFSAAGIIGAVGMLIQKFLDDRQKARDYDLAKRRLEIAAGQNRRVNLAQQKYLVAQHKWWEIFVRFAGKDLPALPGLPVLPEGYESGTDQDYPDA